MNKLLINYIKKYLKEATIPYSARDIDAKLQGSLSPNISLPMTGLSRKDTLKFLAKEAGPNTFISFVAKYDQNIPNFSTNPKASFQTPHGNYGYLLTKDNLEGLVSNFSVDGVTFAMKRPYMLIYKITSPNSIYIEKDGQSNYNESKFIDDIKTITRSFYYYLYSFYYQKNITNKQKTKLKKVDIDSNAIEREMTIDRMEMMLKQILQGVSSLDELIREIHDVMQTYFLSLRNYFSTDSDTNIKSLNEEAINILNFYFYQISSIKESNKFIELYPDSKFHKLYTMCYAFSKTSQGIKRKDAVHKGIKFQNEDFNNGPLFSLLLKEVEIDAVIDKGSKTIHKNEPQQAFVTHFGSKDQRKNIEFLGTFDNIFNEEDYDVRQRQEFYNELLNIYEKNPSYMPDDPVVEDDNGTINEPENIISGEDMIDIVGEKLDHLNYINDDEFSYFMIDPEADFDEEENEWEFFISANSKDSLDEVDMFFFDKVKNILKLPKDHKFIFTIEIDMWLASSNDITSYIKKFITSQYFTQFRKWQKIEKIYLSFKVNSNVKITIDNNICEILKDSNSLEIEMMTQKSKNSLNIFSNNVENIMCFLNKVKLSNAYTNNTVYLSKAILGEDHLSSQNITNSAEYKKLESQIKSINNNIKVV